MKIYKMLFDKDTWDIIKSYQIDPLYLHKQKFKGVVSDIKYVFDMANNYFELLTDDYYFLEHSQLDYLDTMINNVFYKKFIGRYGDDWTRIWHIVMEEFCYEADRYNPDRIRYVYSNPTFDPDQYILSDDESLVSE